MKKKFINLISFFLVLSFLVICFVYYNSNTFVKNIDKNRENYLIYLNSYIEKLDKTGLKNMIKEVLKEDKTFLKEIINEILIEEKLIAPKPEDEDEELLKAQKRRKRVIQIINNNFYNYDSVFKALA